ncbi:hypothetical protein EOL99_04285, partial [Candidatus Falkowbacteria bacterium]|nr:hypothetical protein [Candidatus Falkowbacteria bacterium]
MKKIFKLLIFFLAIFPLTSFGAIDFEHGNFTAENVKFEQKLGVAEQFKPATLINFKTGYRVAVYSDSQAQRYFSLGYELDKGLLGFSVVTNYSTTLSSSITATQTTIPVGTTKDKKGEQLATSTLGMKIYLNIEPG